MTGRQVTMIECPDCGMPIQASREHECDPAKAIRGLSLLRDHLEEELGKMRERCQELETALSAGNGVGLIGELRWQNSRLREERDHLRQRCEKLNAMCIELAEDGAKAESERDAAIQAHDDIEAVLCTVQLYVDALRNERDEARQWANRRTRTANERGKKNDELRYRLTCECGWEQHWQSRLNEHLKTQVDLRAQVKHWQSLYTRELAYHREELERGGRLETLLNELENENSQLRAQLAEARNKALDEAIGAMRSNRR